MNTPVVNFDILNRHNVVWHYSPHNRHKWGIEIKGELEMLARLTAGQRDGHRRRQAEDDFGEWVKYAVLL